MEIAFKIFFWTVSLQSQTTVFLLNVTRTETIIPEAAVLFPKLMSTEIRFIMNTETLFMLKRKDSR